MLGGVGWLARKGNMILPQEHLKKRGAHGYFFNHRIHGTNRYKYQSMNGWVLMGFNGWVNVPSHGSYDDDDVGDEDDDDDDDDSFFCSHPMGQVIIASHWCMHYGTNSASFTIEAVAQLIGKLSHTILG